jgi:hypothetical protein
MRVSRWIRMVGTGFAVASVAIIGAAAADAAMQSTVVGSVPSNDTFAGAVPIPGMPFATTIDTSGATTDADDVEANANCGALATDASVWYSLTAATDGGIVVDVSGSSYVAGVLVVVGEPGSFSFIQCGPSAVAIDATAGIMYYIMAFDDQFDGGGNGGTLVLNVDQIPPPPVVTFAADSTAAFDPRDGSATVHGTMTCVGRVAYARVEVFLTQRVGRGEVVGTGYNDAQCDGEPRPWSVRVLPKYGTKFSGGKAASLTYSFVCGPYQCSENYAQYVVQLSRRG